MQATDDSDLYRVNIFKPDKIRYAKRYTSMSRKVLSFRSSSSEKQRMYSRFPSLLPINHVWSDGTFSVKISTKEKKVTVMNGSVNNKTV